MAKKNNNNTRIFHGLVCAFVFLFFSSVTVSAQTVILRTDCHQASDDDSADYKAGIDVNGQAVVPADLDSDNGLQAIKYPLDIPVEIDVLHWLNLVEKDVLQLDPEAARVTVFEDGRVQYNGQDISSIVNHECIEDIPEYASEEDTSSQDVEKPTENITDNMSEEQSASGQEAAPPVKSEPVPHHEEVPPENGALLEGQAE